MRAAFRLFRSSNAFVAAILRSPLHRLLSGSLVLLTYTGRCSGRTFTLPVMYAREGNRLLVIASGREGKVWWRTFDETPQPVEVLVRGVRLPALATRPTGAAADEVRRCYVARHRLARSTAATAEPIVLDLGH